MSFRKRNVIVAQPNAEAGFSVIRLPEATPLSGVRPSPLDGRPTTSTGTRSLDAILAGHAGMALGSTLSISESGTTDFGGALLRYFAAEGVLQGHHVHVLGVHEQYSRELPGEAVDDGSRRKQSSAGDEKMKIAWRYERLGEFGRDRAIAASPSATSPMTASNVPIFCHDFDLTKRLAISSTAHLNCYATRPRDTMGFRSFIKQVQAKISSSQPNTIHRIIVPQLLSPVQYSIEACSPQHVLAFLHAIRALTRKYSTQLVAMVTIPLSLFPRNTALERVMELMMDGVLELRPFPANAAPVPASASSTSQEEPPQGLLKVHRLPVFHERGGGGGEASGIGEDLAFNLSRRKGLMIRPYNLPPVEGDDEAQGQGVTTASGDKASKGDIEF